MHSINLITFSYLSLTNSVLGVNFQILADTQCLTVFPIKTIFSVKANVCAMNNKRKHKNPTHYYTIQ